MERRVIKFNLMGAIGILLLIIGSIVGIVVFVSHNNNSTNDKKVNQTVENKDDYKEVETKQIVRINGRDTEVTFNRYESKNLKYAMNYAPENFYFDESQQDKDIFGSLESSTIMIEVSKNEQGSTSKSDEIVNGQYEKHMSNYTYRLCRLNVGDKVCYGEQEINEGILYYNYYIEYGNIYYAIKLQCGEQFKEAITPIFDRMVGSFEIM